MADTRRRIALVIIGLAAGIATAGGSAGGLGLHAIIARVTAQLPG